MNKQLNGGYALGGNKSSIWFEKGNDKIVFDTKNKTPKGAIFTAYFKRKAMSKMRS